MHGDNNLIFTKQLHRATRPSCSIEGTVLSQPFWYGCAAPPLKESLKMPWTDKNASDSFNKQKHAQMAVGAAMLVSSVAGIVKKLAEAKTKG